MVASAGRSSAVPVCRRYQDMKSASSLSGRPGRIHRTSVRAASRRHRQEVPMASVKPIPDQYPQVTPYLCVEGAGAKALSPVQNQFYGDRSGQFEDPFGHRWSVASHIEDVPPEEMAKRAAEAMG